MSAEAGEPSERRERPAGVVGIAAGLLLLAALAAGLARSAFGGFDAEAELARLAPDGLPFGLELADAAELAGGARVLRLAASSAPAEDAPDEVFLFLTRDASDAAGRFGAAGEDAERYREWERDPTFGFSAALDRGELEWDGWRAPRKRLRRFDEGGGWCEALLVNVSRRDRPLLVLATWPEERDFSEEAMRAILRTLELDRENEA